MTNTERTRPAHAEVLGLLVFGALFLLVNLFTALQYPVVWLDEIMFTDPAANLHLGHGFTTSAWPYLHEHEFFAGYPPLYSLLLAGWMTLTGLTPTGVRAFNHVLILASAALLWWTLLRGGWGLGPRERFTAVVLVLLGYGVSMGYRAGRPDALTLLIVTVAFFAFTVQHPGRRYTLLIVSGLCMPWAGLQLVPYCVMMAFLLLVFLGRRRLLELSAILLGVGIGGVALLALYAAHGAFGDFLLSIRGETSTGLIGALLGRGEFKPHNKLPKDFSLILVAAAIGLLSIAEWRAGRFRWRSPLGFGIACLVLVSPGMVAAGKLPTYYAWMIYVPLVVCFAMAIHTVPGAAVRAAGTALATAACLVGLPFQLAFTSYDLADRHYEPIQRLVDQHIRAGDTVFTDYGAYYAVKNKAARVYTRHYLGTLSAPERAAVSVMIVDPAVASKAEAILGGAWHPEGPEIKPAHGTLAEDLLGISVQFGALDCKYHLQVYRRGTQST